MTLRAKIKHDQIWAFDIKHILVNKFINKRDTPGGVTKFATKMAPTPWIDFSQPRLLTCKPSQTRPLKCPNTGSWKIHLKKIARASFSLTLTSPFVGSRSTLHLKNRAIQTWLERFPKIFYTYKVTGFQTFIWKMVRIALGEPFLDGCL